MARIALIGSNGQLGSDIVRAWPTSPFGHGGDQLVSLIHSDIEVTDPDNVRSVLSGVQPTLVINTAAFHRVDDCENEPDEAFRVNGLGTKILAEACRALGATLVHFSADYVFDGSAKTPYKETDRAWPVSAYGISKLAGEHFLRYTLPDEHIIVRSSGLYGVAGASGKGGNFVETMLRQAREGREITVVDDQVTAPTYTLDLAETVLEIIAAGGRGTYHVTNSGQCSWYEFAREIFALLGSEPQLSPISSAEYGTPAKRPAYSVLANAALAKLGIEQPRPWREALCDYLELKGHLKAA